MQFLYPIVQQTKFLSLRSDIEVLLCQVQAIQKMRSNSSVGSGPDRVQVEIDRSVYSRWEEGRNEWVS